MTDVNLHISEEWFPYGDGKNRKIDRVAMREDYISVFMSTEAGKRVLNDLVNREAGLYRTAFNGNSDSQTAFNCGKHALAQHILNVLNIQLQQVKDGIR